MEKLEVKAAGLELIPTELHEVKQTLEGSIWGTVELADFVKAFYKAWNVFKNMSGGFNVISVVAGLLQPLIASYMGANEAVAEVMDLQDTEIAELVNLADGYDLGADHAKAKQCCKCILVILQTYSVFKNGR